MKRKSVQRDEAAEAVALDVLGWLVADGDRLYPFLNATGLEPATLRASLGDRAVLTAILDHVMGDEAVLVACAAALERPPERIAAAWRALSPPEPEDI